MRSVVLLALAVALCAEAPPDSTQVLTHARDSLAARGSRLPNYTCVQTVDRSYLRRAIQPQPVPSCGQMHEQRESGAYVPQIYLTDRLRLDVKVSAGQEIGSWAGASQFESQSIFELVDTGPFGTGLLGTLLNDIFTTGGARFEYQGEKSAGGMTVYEYRFEVPLKASHYQVQVGRAWRAIAYEGEVQIDPRSGDLRHLLVRTNEMPPEGGACETATNVDYARVRIGAGDFLLPQQSKLHILMTDTYESDTRTGYAGCREYHSEAPIHFDDAAPAADGRKAEVAAPRTLPAGLPLVLALTAPIDTETAAAGDVVLEKVRKAVRAPGSKDVLIPAGATVQGRIIRMRHWLDSPERFEIAMRLETWETGGSALPLSAKPVHSEPGQPAALGTFVFTTQRDRYVVPRGYETKWVTVGAGSD